MNRPVIRTYLAIAGIIMGILAFNAGFSMYLKSNIPMHVWNKESGGLIDLQNVTHKIHSLKNKCDYSGIILGSSVSKDINIGSSINLSFLGAAMKIQDKVVALLEESLAGCTRTEAKIYLEILPPLFTKRSTTSFADKNNLKASYIMSWGEILKFPIVEAFQLATLKIRNYTAPEMTLNLIRWKIYSQSNKTDPDTVLSVFDKMYDLKNADFDPEEIQRLQAVIVRLSKLSSNLVLFIPPQNQESWSYTPEAQVRIHSLIARFKNIPGVTVVRSNEIFKASEFRDPLHLTTKGIERFQMLLKN